MTLKRDGTPQRMNPVGLQKRVACGECGAVMRACNLGRHQRRRHDPGYVPPSRTQQYRRTHRTRTWTMTADRKRYYEDAAGSLYLIHFSRPFDGGSRPQHYMGWTSNLMGRLVAHRDGQGSRLTRAAALEGNAFALTWAAPGTRSDERAIKGGRKLAELCSLCRDDALAKRAARMRSWRARPRKEAV